MTARMTINLKVAVTFDVNGVRIADLATTRSILETNLLSLAKRILSDDLVTDETHANVIVADPSILPA